MKSMVRHGNYNIPAFILGNYKINEKSGCWEWQGQINEKGYGVYTHKGKTYRAHRIFIERAGYKIPIGKLVCHKCDNSKCVNPSHLFIGTPKDNTQDMIKKGRMVVGEERHNSKLNEKQIIDIRKSFLPSILLARKYNVHRSCIDKILRKATWKHLD